MALALSILTFLCVLIFVLALKAAIHYLTHLHCSENRRKAEIGGTEERVEVPELIYTEGMKLGGEETKCIICLSDFTAGENFTVMDKCNHGFHADCVQRWLTSHSSCPGAPTCRTNCCAGKYSEDCFFVLLSKTGWT